MDTYSQEMLQPFDLSAMLPAWKAAKPFNHLVIDDFLSPQVAQAVAAEFPSFDSDEWRSYNNPLEVKKLQNHWDKFGPTTYRLFAFLNSQSFIARLQLLTECELYADVGLNGGGLHTHSQGGKLNTHLDYSIHPKLRLERRLNLLIYVTPDWINSWGGRLGLWEKDARGHAPGRLIESIDCRFNRAVLFDTTQDSWHGLPEPITCPTGVTRNSLAVYYLCQPRVEASDRGKALFAPHGHQADDPAVLELIERRSSVAGAASVYGGEL